VIHLEDTSPANPTMMASIWLIFEAPLAVTPLARCFHLMGLRLIHMIPITEIPFYTFGNPTRWCENTESVACEEEKDQSLRNCSVDDAALLVLVISPKQWYQGKST